MIHSVARYRCARGSNGIDGNVAAAFHRLACSLLSLPSSLFSLRPSPFSLLPLLLILSSGCASVNLPGPPVEDVAEKRKQRSEEALRQFDKNRDFAEFQAAMAEYGRGDLTGCRETLTRLIERNGKHCDARLMLAELYLADNRPQEALEQVQPALGDHPHDARVQYTAGLTLDAMGQASGALAHYRQAAELQPNNELYAISHRTALDAATGGDVSNDRSGYAAVAGSDTVPGGPDNPEIPIAAAVAALRADRPDQAVELLRPAAGRGCGSATAYRILGLAHYRLGDYRSSQVALQQALSLDKSSALTYFLMGCTLARLGSAESAEACWEQGRAMDPRYSAGR